MDTIIEDRSHENNLVPTYLSWFSVTEIDFTPQIFALKKIYYKHRMAYLMSENRFELFMKLLCGRQAFQIIKVTKVYPVWNKSLAFTEKNKYVHYSMVKTKSAWNQRDQACLMPNTSLNKVSRKLRMRYLIRRISLYLHWCILKNCRFSMSQCYFRIVASSLFCEMFSDYFVLIYVSIPVFLYTYWTFSKDYFTYSSHY